MFSSSISSFSLIKICWIIFWEGKVYESEGWTDELLAVRKTNDKYLVVVYKEFENDGFIITAFITKKVNKILKRGIVWQKM